MELEQELVKNNVQKAEETNLVFGHILNLIQKTTSKVLNISLMKASIEELSSIAGGLKDQTDRFKTK